MVGTNVRERGDGLKAFRDPVHDIIYFDKDSEKLLLDLIDT